MITQKEYQSRRQALASRLAPDSIAVIPAATEYLRNGDSHFRFRQESDFYYLTGFNEPDALLLITSGSASQSILFNRPRDPVQEQWTGQRLGQDDASLVLGVDAAYDIADCDARLPEFLAGKHAIFYAIGRHPMWQQRILDAWQGVKGQLRRGVVAPESLYDLMPLLSEMRLFKSQAEIQLMQRAIQVSVSGHQRAMRASMRAQYEYELEAELLDEFTRKGCRDLAYGSIVAGGSHACVLHYTDNNKPLKPGELVLIDAGAEYQNYAADITRTFPLNGHFSSEQRSIYELVLRAQQAGIACVKPGCAWDVIQSTMVQILTEGLVELGLLRGSVSELIERGAYKLFYPHSSGHWLGLDVHDCGAYKWEGQWRMLEPGMVLTVEPGIYISPGMSDVDSRWWGIGVRIEDDIHVTLNGHDNLSGDLAVEVDDIEALIRG
jgi:Xaa-Pro aminopeptidase